jgi:hypothetical protein
MSSREGKIDGELNCFCNTAFKSRSAPPVLSVAAGHWSAGS